MRRLLLWAVILLAVGGLGTWYFVRGRASSDKQLRYETATVERGHIAAKVTATGTLSALVTVQVGSQVSGRIQSLFADFNTPVKKSQVLARIDPQLFEAAVEQARANHMAARSNLTKARVQAVEAKRQYDRTKALAERKLVAPADLDTAQASYEAAQAQVEAARGSVAQTQAALHQAEINLNFTTIHSPIDGIVISRNVDVGQTVAASLQAPTLFTIAEDLKKMQVDTSVAEADVGKLSPGMDASFTVDAYPGEQFRGTVRQIRNAPQTVQNVVTYDAVIDVDNPDLKLKPGMTATVTFVYAEKDEVLKVPNAALRFRPPPELTAKVGGTANGGKAATGGAAAGGRGEGGAGGTEGEAKGTQATAGGTAREAAEARNSTGSRAGAEAASEAADRSGRGTNARGGAPGTNAQGGARGTNAQGGARGGPPDRRTVWVLRNDTPVPVSIKTGISDGTATEVTDGDLHEGDLVITSTSGGEGEGRGGSSGNPMRGMRRIL